MTPAEVENALTRITLPPNVTAKVIRATAVPEGTCTIRLEATWPNLIGNTAWYVDPELIARARGSWTLAYLLRDAVRELWRIVADAHTRHDGDVLRIIAG